MNVKLRRPGFLYEGAPNHDESRGCFRHREPADVTPITRAIHQWTAHATLSSISIALAIEFLPALACGALMEKKGRSNVLGFMLAFFLSIVGVAIVLMIPPANRPPRAAIPKPQPARGPNPQTRTRTRARTTVSQEPPAEVKICSFCGVPVPADAAVCRVCQANVGSQIAV